MNKSDLIDSISKRSGLSKDESEKALNALTGSIGDTLASGDKVVLQGIGTFQVADRAARKGRSPRTGEPIDIPAGKRVSYKAAKALKEKVSL